MKSKRVRRSQASNQRKTPYTTTQYREDLNSMVSPTCQDLGIPTDVTYAEMGVPTPHTPPRDGTVITHLRGTSPNTTATTTIVHSQEPIYNQAIEGEYTYQELQKIISSVNDITNDQNLYASLGNQPIQSQNTDEHLAHQHYSNNSNSNGNTIYSQEYIDNENTRPSPPHDPFSPACRIPLPDPFGDYPGGVNDIANVRRRNERERERVRCVNDGYAELRRRLPLENQDKRISKVETLRGAVRYIQYLMDVLEGRVDANQFELGQSDGSMAETNVNLNEDIS